MNVNWFKKNDDDDDDEDSSNSGDDRVVAIVTAKNACNLKLLRCLAKKYILQRTKKHNALYMVF